MPTQTFTASGTFTPGAGVTAVHVLVVAGGGGGGVWDGGGGGGGGVVSTYDVGGSTYTVTPGVGVTVTVGAGGTGGAASNSAGSNGSNSAFGTITATGGGGGGSGPNVIQNVGLSGGSGGGGAYASSAAGGSGTAGQGNSGGSGIAVGGTNVSGGGGGGATSAGAAAASGQAGAGGSGYTSSISGSSVTYGGGGGGGADASSSFGVGGSGGGGSGGNVYAAGASGTTNTGGGGGGAGGASTSGGAGGSGVVIVSWTNPPAITSAATMSAVAGQAATYQITATNSPTSYGFTWIIPSSGSSSFNTSTGLFSITPSTAGTYSFTVSATNSGGTATLTVTMTVLSVTGPSTSVVGDVALFANTSGTVIEDGGALGSAAFVSSSMGGDLSSTLPNPTVVAVHETGGPTRLAIDSVPDGSFLKRSGTTLIGGTPSGAGNVTGPASSTDGNLAVFNGTSGEIIKDGGPVPTSLPPSGTAGGILSGTYPNPALSTGWPAMNIGAVQIGECEASSGAYPGSLTLGPIGYATGNIRFFTFCCG